MEQLPQIMHPSWHKFMQPLFDDPKMAMIKKMLFVDKVRFYPEAGQIFRVFEMPIDAIRVVILGQDVYPNGEGIGLAFAVNLATKIPPSLRIIKNEVDTTVPKEQQYFKKSEDFSWRTLEHWHRQGVFLLNTALTVERGNAGSHLGIWQWFTREVIRIIAIQCHPVWMLWGAKAKGFKDFISNNYPFISNIEIPVNVLMNGNFILEADHPAAETYPNSKYKFTGCNHFNLCNEILKAKNQSLIKW